MTKVLARMWALTLLAMLPASVLMAQAATKATVQIRKNVNGQEETQTEEFVLQEGQTIQDILQELDLLDEFGQLKGGQSFEISIKKMDAAGGTEDIEMMFSPTQVYSDQPFLGVYLKESSDEGQPGAEITSIIEDTAAEAEELQEGDIIVRVDDAEIDGVQALVREIREKSPGDKVKIHYVRDGKKKNKKVTLGNRPQESVERFMWNGEGGNHFLFDSEELPPPPPPASEPFEIQAWPECEDLRFFSDTVIFAPFDVEGDDIMEMEIETEERAFLGVSPKNSWEHAEEEGHAGVLIGNVVEGSSAETMGLLEGDIIRSFNGTATENFGQLADLIGECEPGQKVKMEILRDGKKENITGEIGKREYCNTNDFRIFHDLKGMDENGNLFYNYDFEFDSEELQEGLLELKLGLEELQENMPQVQEEIRLELEKLREHEELAFMFEDSAAETMDISIHIADISEAELARINENAEIALRAENDLELDAISFFPNPTLGQINLSFQSPTSEAQTLEIRLYDQAGNTVYRESQSGFSGSYEGVIDISEEASGTYYLQIVCGEKSYSRKVIKKS